MSKEMFAAKLHAHTYEQLIAAVDAGKKVVLADNDAYTVTKTEDRYYVECSHNGCLWGFTEHDVDYEEWIWKITEPNKEHEFE